MGVSKVNLGDETLVDLTGTTVNSQNLLKGATAIGADGEPVEGAVTYAPITTSLAVTEEGVSALDGTVGKILNDKIDEIIVGNLYKTKTVSIKVPANTKLTNALVDDATNILSATLKYNSGAFYLMPVLSINEKKYITVICNHYTSEQTIEVIVLYI